MSDFTSREKGKQVWRKLATCCRFLDYPLSRKHPGACPWGTEHMCKLSLIRGQRPTPKDPWPCNRALGSFIQGQQDLRLWGITAGDTNMLLPPLPYQLWSSENIQVSVFTPKFSHSALHSPCKNMQTAGNPRAQCSNLKGGKYFRIVVLEKTLESPLNCKEIRPARPKENQPWMFIGRTDAEAEAPILWPPDAKSWIIGKDPTAGKDWG